MGVVKKEKELDLTELSKYISREFPPNYKLSTKKVRGRVIKLKIEHQTNDREDQGVYINVEMQDKIKSIDVTLKQVGGYVSHKRDLMVEVHKIEKHDIERSRVELHRLLRRVLEYNRAPK